MKITIIKGFIGAKSAVFLFLILTLLYLPQVTEARVTPEDIVNTKKEAFTTEVQTYSDVNKERLTKVSDRISEINKRRTSQLSWIMEAQAGILDEYVRRNGGKETESIEKARYWITFAHEAVAYQAAKIYIFDLNGEGSINRDINNLIGIFQSDLNSTRGKVINSQEILEQTINK